MIEVPPAPFQAAAEFHSHGESYLLIKSAKLWEMDSNEFVYFSAEDTLTAETVLHRIETAWNLAMPQIHPVFLTNLLPEDARKLVSRTNRSKGYKHGMQGWSNLRLGAIELSTGRIACNRHGRDLKKLLSNIMKSNAIGE